MKKPVTAIILFLCLLFTGILAVSCKKSNDPLHVHSFGEWVTVTEPTCQAEGLRRQTCSCGEVREEAVPAAAHRYENGVCADCGAEQATLQTIFTQKHKKNFVTLWGDFFRISSVAEFDAACEIRTYSGEVVGTPDIAEVRVLMCNGSFLALEFSSEQDRKQFIEYQPAFSSPYSSINIGRRFLAVQPFYNGAELIRAEDFVLSQDGSVLYRYLGSSAAVEIPGSVTSIGNSAFSGCERLASVDIPDSVASIGNSAFYGCHSLTSVVIPDFVTSIGNSAFSGCNSLASVDIPNSVTSIGNSAFSGCRSLASVLIPDSVTSIGNSAFAFCDSLVSVIIPDSVTFIGNDAFSGCDSLASVVIPDSVTRIGDNVFSGCYNLTIYAEAKIQPNGWSNDWNRDSRPVVWGYSGGLENATDTKNNGDNTVVNQPD